MINIVSTGIAGCGEREYFERFKKYCMDRSKKVNYISVTEKVLEVARRTHPEINRYNLLNFPKTTRDAWYQRAFELILKELKKDAINLVNIHVTYWWKDGPEDVVGADILDQFFKKLDPIFFIQIVDTPETIKIRTDGVVEHIGRTLSIEDIYRWQDMEHFVVSIFSRINKKQLYLIPHRQAEDTLYSFIFTKDLKVYFSFPMTHMTKTEKRKFVNFLKKLNKLAIVFNPEKIEEFPRYTGRLKRISSDATIKRDYWLINQSDMVVAYFPKIVHSAGVVSEMNYAGSIGKIVYLIWPFKKYSPFTTLPAQKMFSSPEACLNEIKRLVGERFK